MGFQHMPKSRAAELGSEGGKKGGRRFTKEEAREAGRKGGQMGSRKAKVEAGRKGGNARVQAAARKKVAK